MDWEVVKRFVQWCDAVIYTSEKVLEDEYNKINEIEDFYRIEEMNARIKAYSECREWFIEIAKKKGIDL